MILVCENTRARDWQIEKSWEQNSDGAGIVFPSGTNNGRATFIKGLELKQVKKLSVSVPLPYAIHFRLATVGGKCAELTHPFPVHPKVPNVLTGSFGKVIMHNGHWSKWEEYLLNSYVSRRSKLAKGKWSDSRAIAALMAFHGEGIANLTGGRVLVHDGKEIRLYGTGWQKCEEIMASGYLAKHTAVYHGYPANQYQFAGRSEKYDGYSTYSEYLREGLERRRTEIRQARSIRDENETVLSKQVFDAMVKHSQE